mmetsp:Transcript_25538/g.40920  ORF Transcript_25538/g.40920 Transcript_25538/m.40920 type:complete len:444 (-) Transcript_25538:187-1518(-)
MEIVAVLIAVLHGIASRCVSADQGKEMTSLPFPMEGPIGPDTYLADATLTDCGLLDPYPASASLPWNPTVEEAATTCSQKVNCGGFVYRTASANLAQSGTNLATALYCSRLSFVAGTSSATSGIGFVRHVYASCDLRMPVAATVSTHYGNLAYTRQACVRPGRGLSPARGRSPKPVQRKQQSPPKPMITLSGTTYEIGKEVFLNVEDARNASADGTTHSMASADGVFYYMPGATHGTREQYEKPFARDGWYPLYSTEAGAQAASTRGGGNGVAHSVGPTSSSGLPAKWLTAPHVEVHWMPSDGVAQTYLGDLVAPFTLDGYYPLYRDEADAKKAASNGLAQSHGPGSTMGHPLSWSTGETLTFYMPAEGVALHFGSYYNESEAAAPLYSQAAALQVKSPSGISAASDSAASIAAAEAYHANFPVPATAAAQIIIASAPDYTSR